MADAPTTRRYQEIENWLRDKVIQGREGDPLPSESELAVQFNVSRMTARQAVQNLASENLVRRKRGSGTFIAPRPMHRYFGPLMSFTADMRRRGLTATSLLLTAELRVAAAAEIEALRLAPGARLVAIARTRVAGGSPMAIEHTVLTPDCVGVLSHDLEHGSLHDALREMGREPTTALCWISTRLASPEEAKALNITTKSPALVERRIISDQHGAPLELTTTVYHPDRYVIDAVFALSGSDGTTTELPATLTTEKA